MSDRFARRPTILLAAASVGWLVFPKSAPAQCERPKLTASDGAAGDQFGGSVSIGGDWLVVGAQFDDEGGDYSGSAYVFRRDDNDTPSDVSDDFWIQAAKLTPADASTGDNFGVAVSISGDRLVVGAQFDDDGGGASGSAYVFRRDDNGTPTDPNDDLWVQEAKLTASDATSGELFGFSVSISADRAVVGAYRGGSSGSAYVFRRDDNGTPSDPSDDIWVQEAKLVPADRPPHWLDFGKSVSMDGDWVVVGVRLDDAVGSYSGSAYVFFRNDNGTPLDPSDDRWIQSGKLIPSDAAQFAQFGVSVSISGNRIVGGRRDVSTFGGTIEPGSAYVFRRYDNGTPLDPSDDSWIEEAKLVAVDAELSDGFGGWVSISGDRIAVGASRNDDAGTASGSAYVFRQDDNATPSDPSDDVWVQAAKLVAVDARSYDRFGFSVAISGEWTIVGSPDDDDAGYSSGSVYAAYVLPEAATDCNMNNLDDACDLNNGTSQDTNMNGVPDECEIDGACCNWVTGTCDISFGFACTGFLKEFAEGDSCDRVDCGCADDYDCPGDRVCTVGVCQERACTLRLNQYGDVDHSGFMNIFDLLCVLDAFAGDFEVCRLEDADIQPCEGNGTINIFDLFAVLNSFVSDFPLCCKGFP